MSDINAEKVLADEAMLIIQTVRDAFLLLDGLKVVFANSSFYSIFKVTPEETVGKKIYEVGDGQWNIPDLRVLIEETLSKNQEFHDYKVTHDFPEIGKKTMLLNGMLVKHDHYLTLLVISDITAQQEAHEALEDAFGSLKKMNEYMVGREVKMAQLKKEMAQLKATVEKKLKEANIGL